MKKFVIIFLLAFMGCQNKQKSSTATPNYMQTKYYNFESYLNDKNNAIEKGDIEAYKRLGLFYSYNPKYAYEYISTSLIMAEKYSVDFANYNVFYSIVKFYNNNIFTSNLFKNLNEQQKEFALYYLNRGADQNDLNCIIELARIYRYGIGINKDIEKAENIEKVLKKMQPNYDIKKTDSIELHIER